MTTVIFTCVRKRAVRRWRPVSKCIRKARRLATVRSEGPAYERVRAIRNEVRLRVARLINERGWAREPRPEQGGST